MPTGLHVVTGLFVDGGLGDDVLTNEIVGIEGGQLLHPGIVVAHFAGLGIGGGAEVLVEGERGGLLDGVGLHERVAVVILGSYIESGVEAHLDAVGGDVVEGFDAQIGTGVAAPA